MAWNQIIGNDRVKKILQRAIVENRISHSYCLSGIEGIGKEAIAIQFAKTVNCLKPIIKKNTIDSCDHCDSCKKFNDLSHPNFDMIFALPAGKTADSKNDSPLMKLSDEQINNVINERLNKAKNPYHKISIQNANQIKVNLIREIKRKLVMSDSTFGRRVVLIVRADEMTTEASNAFLKTLEEPHPNVTIFITTAYIDSILPTIMSRCQQIKCSPIDEKVLAEYLIQKHNYSASEANFAAVFGQGSYLRALEAMNHNMQDLRYDIISALRTSLKRKNYRFEMMTQIEKLLSSKDKNRLEAIMMILLYWMKDVYNLMKLGENARIINTDQKDALIKFANNFKDTNLTLAITEIEKSINLIERNINQQLIFLPLFIKLRRIFLQKNI